MDTTKYHKAYAVEEHPQKKRWADKAGRRYVFEVGIALSCISLACLLVAFVSPAWIVSWPRVHSGFKKLGLWQVCFSGLVLDLDPNQKAYHGCWWILAPEFKAIRDWLFPAWFVCTQITVSLCLCAQIINVGLLLGAYCGSGGCDPEKTNIQNRKQPNIKLLATTFIITCATAFFLSGTVIYFAISFYFDLGWLPMHYLNYLSWGYGLCVLAGMTQCLAAMAQGCHFALVRRELKEPPRDTSFLHPEKKDPRLDASLKKDITGDISYG